MWMHQVFSPLWAIGRPDRLNCLLLETKQNKNTISLVTDQIQEKGTQGKHQGKTSIKNCSFTVYQ